MSGSQRRKARKARGGKKAVHDGRKTSASRFAYAHKEQLQFGPPRRIAQTDRNNVPDAPKCGAHIPDPETGELEIIYLKKKRGKTTPQGPAGSFYQLRIIVSPVCNEPALLTKSIDGLRVHRCGKHSFADE
jgi:hypothetical protein